MKRWVKLIIISFIILSSIVFEISGLSTSFGSYYPYIIKPLIWIFIGIIAFFFFKNEVTPNLKYKKDITFYIIVTLLIYYLIYFGLGYIKGFAHNPYDRSINGILNNLWTFIPVLLVKEYLRFYMINNVNKKRILLSALFIALIFALVDLNLYKFDTYFSTRLSTLEFIMHTLIPSVLVNLYLTYIVYYSGYKTSIIYLFFQQISLYILPILPDLEWSLTSIINCTIPFFSYLYINYMINKMDKTLNMKDNKVVDLKSMLAMFTVILLMVAFGLGVFPVQPLVIASNSMYPKIKKGDIVIIQDIDVNDIKKGDIIRYKMDNYYVIHRVVMIAEDKDGLYFVMKGDNNDNVDLYPVRSSMVDGIIKFDIPYAGYPTLIVNKMVNPEREDTVKVDKGRMN